MSSFWTELFRICAVILVAWLTAKYALRRDKAAWVKEAQQRTLQTCMGRAGEIINWANGETHYPYLPLMYLQLDLISLGAAALLPDLKAIRAKAARLDIRGREREKANLPLTELEAESRDLMGDVIFLGIKLQHHVHKSIGLPVYPIPGREEIDA